VQQDIYLWSLNAADKEHIRDLPWIAFLDGKNPGYPVTALRNDLDRVRERMQRIRDDASTRETRSSDYSQRFNPVATTALVNLTLGGNEPGTSGNSLHSQVRYFDPQAKRAGLPPDAAALVTGITPAGVMLTLVNTSTSASREIVVQAGAYGEHQFTTVAAGGRNEQVHNEQVNAPSFTVRLEPGAGASFENGKRRYVKQPAMKFPSDSASE
jgi:hypothetical protein